MYSVYICMYIYNNNNNNKFIRPMRTKKFTYMQMEQKYNVNNYYM